jgi:transcriptional regulator with XRE-family HTH domain
MPARPLLRTTLGDVLRRIRLEQGRTLADVADAARMSMQYLSELERGRKEASSEILAAICDALEVDLPDVLAEVGRELASAGAIEQQAIVLRLRTGPDQLAPRQLAPSRPVPSAPQAVVGLLAA